MKRQRKAKERRRQRLSERQRKLAARCGDKAAKRLSQRQRIASEAARQGGVERGTGAATAGCRADKIAEEEREQRLPLDLPATAAVLFKLPC